MKLNFKIWPLLIIMIINGLANSVWAHDILSISVTTDKNEISVDNKDMWSKYLIRDGYGLEITGAPELPYKIINVALPAATKILSIQASGSQFGQLAEGLNYAWFAGDIRTDANGQQEHVVKNETLYNSNDLFPGKYYEILNQGHFGPQPIVTIAIYPLQLRPVSGQLLITGEIVLQIALEYDPNIIPTPAPPGTNEIRSMVVNPERMMSAAENSLALTGNGLPGTSPMGLGGEYLLITSAELAPAFYPYVMWKNQKGIITELVLIEDVLANYQGIDDAAKLRAYLQEAYASRAKWALLGGDEDIIPIRYAYHGNASIAPSLADQQVTDVYYSDLNGDWDFDQDGIYGESNEDHVDLLPEIYVGRIPAETVEEVQIWVEKALLYEQNPGHGDYSYLTKALIISADQMRDLNEHTALAQLIPDNFTVDYSRCAEEPSGSAPAPTQPTAQSVISVMDEGWGFVTNLNHGNFYAYSAMAPNYNYAPRSFLWGDTCNADNGAGSFTHLLESDKYSIYYSISCEVAAFDFDKNTVRPGPFITNHTLMEAYLFRPNRAGVAFLGNTRWGWVSASFKLEQKFLEYVFNDSIRHIGVAEALSKVFYPSYRDIDYGNNLFGDPEMVIWKAPPVPLTITASDTIYTDSSSLAVVVSTPGGPAAGTRICVWKPGEFYYRGITDDSGRIDIPLSLVNGGRMHVTATAADKIPAIDTINVYDHVGIDDIAEKPGQVSLGQAYPNPFNSITSINFARESRGHITLEIFDLTGKKVKTLVDDIFPAGQHAYKWDGRNDQNQQVASGIYIYRLKSDIKEFTRKMVLLK